MDINNQVALITGAGGGLGKETARRLAKAGAIVGLLDQKPEEISKLAKELNGIALVADVTNTDQIKNSLDRIKTKFGNPRIVVNCAGIIYGARLVGKQGPFPLEEFNRVISINLIGTFNVMRLAAEGMISETPLNEIGERGIIINTASVAASEGQIGQVAYSASKGGVTGMTLPAARDLAPFGIRVVSICPGVMETPMITDLPEKIQTDLKSSVMFPKTLGKPEYFAHFVQQIIENCFLNGSNLRLDGAARMPP